MERHQITGHTELIGLMAYPIRHSQSPATHNAAYEKLGVDIVNLAFEVNADDLEDAIKGLRALKMRGSNISMPNNRTQVSGRGFSGCHALWRRQHYRK